MTLHEDKQFKGQAVHYDGLPCSQPFTVLGVCMDAHQRGGGARMRVLHLWGHTVYVAVQVIWQAACFIFKLWLYVCLARMWSAWLQQDT